MKKKQQRMVRILAIILAALLAGGAIISAVISIAYAEEAEIPARNACALTMEYLEEEQALRMSQRLVYTNETDAPLDRLLFYAPANLMRRLSALPYDAQQLADAFPKAYYPAGFDIISIAVDGVTADWGFQGEDESWLRVGCALEPGQSAVFAFEYYLLLSENEAFLGTSNDNWRLSGFYFSPASIDENGAFICNAALSHARYIDSPAISFDAEIALPQGCLLAATGTEEILSTEGGQSKWRIHAENAREFVLCFAKEYRETTLETDSGVMLRGIGDARGMADALETAKDAVDTCAAWFGALPIRQIDIVQTGADVDFNAHEGCLWISKKALKEGGDSLAHSIRAFIAMQYFGFAAYSRPVSDAWLSDAVSNAVAYLLLEEAEGYDAYLAALNKDIVPALQLTIPGGLNVTSNASFCTPYEYQIVVKDRGAAVFHELRTAMGRDEMIAGLRNFYKMGLARDVLTEMNLVEALDAASGRSWEKFLTDWVFNIGDYANQTIDWLD